jgi:AraC family transcriptional regulator
MIVKLKTRAASAGVRDRSRGPLGDACYVMSERSRLHFYSGAGPLSIKSFYGGRALYDVGAGRYGIDDRCYLILNDRQSYSITVDVHEPLESFCLFFAPGFAEGIVARMVSRTERLLDDPDSSAAPIAFVERTYPHDDVLSPALDRLRSALPLMHGDHLWLEERLHEIVERLVLVHRRVLKEVGAVPAVRASTRDEIYRRLHRARDYASACYDQPVTLDAIARAACLSPNHLLRSFQRVFGRTPHQYLTEVRLDRARELLERTDHAVTEVCFAVGYESLGSFSTLFRRRFGASPEKYRLQKKGDFREAGSVRSSA